jgi:hypothetical protein
VSGGGGEVDKGDFSGRVRGEGSGETMQMPGSVDKILQLERV